MRFKYIALTSLLLCSVAFAQRGTTSHRISFFDELNRRVTDVTSVNVLVTDTTNSQTIYQDQLHTTTITQPMTAVSANTTLSGNTCYWYGTDSFELTVISTSLGTATYQGLNGSVSRIIIPTYLPQLSSLSTSDAQSITLGTDSDWVFTGGATANRLTFQPATDGATFYIGDGSTDADVRFFAGATTVYAELNEGTAELDLVGYDIQWDDDSLGYFGTGKDWSVTYDEGTDDQLLFVTTGTTCTADTDPMFEILVGTTPDADQQVFGIGKGTQASNTAILTVDEDGDQVNLGTLALSAGDDLLDNATDDVLNYTSNDAASTYRATGFEAAEARLQLLADQDDDATDGWELAASAAGTLTVGNDQSVAGTFVDVLTIAGATGNLTLTGDIINENADTLVMSTDDTISFQSNDAASVIQSLGFEASEGAVVVAADQDDDATDAWEIAASVTGTLTIGNDSSVAGTFVDKLTIAGATGNVTLTGDIVNENDDTLVMSTDDTLQYTSNDAAATFQVLGFEANSAILSLDADEADDNADTWTHTVADGGAYTIANEGTATMTINEVVGFGSGTTIADVVITDAATYTLLAANSGKAHILTDLAQNTDIDLPAEADGLNYEIWYCGATETHDHTIDSQNDTNYFIGGVGHNDTDGETSASVTSDGANNSKLTINNAETGTFIKLTCDGTNWYVTGSVFSDTAPAFANQ